MISLLSPPARLHNIALAAEWGRLVTLESSGIAPPYSGLYKPTGWGVHLSEPSDSVDRGCETLQV